MENAPDHVKIELCNMVTEILWLAPPLQKLVLSGSYFDAASGHKICEALKQNSFPTM